MEDIGKRLAKLRRGKGLNQEELAEKLGVSRQAVSKWERGESTPDIANLVSLSELYQVSIDYLAKGEGEGDPLSSSEVEPAEESATPNSASAEREAPANDAAQADEPVGWAALNSDATGDYSQVGACGQVDDAFAPTMKRRSSPLLTFPYPIVVIMLYLFIGFAFDGWHPWWWLFFTIPVCYWIVNVIVHDPEYMAEHPQYKTSGR